MPEGSLEGTRVTRTVTSSALRKLLGFSEAMLNRPKRGLQEQNLALDPWVSLAMWDAPLKSGATKRLLGRREVESPPPSAAQPRQA